MGQARFAGGRRAAVGVVAIFGFASCAHDGHADERPVAARAPAVQHPAPPAPPLNRRALLGIGGVGYEEWIGQLRECTAADAAASKPHLPGAQADLAKRQPAVSIEGRLVPAGAECTLIDCGGGCCNGCEFQWVVAPRRDCPGRKLRVSLRGPATMTGGGPDCAVIGYGADADWVIVTGRIGGLGDVVVDADLCRLKSPTKDPLSDADYDRLTRSGRPGRSAGSGPCP